MFKCMVYPELCREHVNEAVEARDPCASVCGSITKRARLQPYSVREQAGSIYAKWNGDQGLRLSVVGALDSSYELSGSVWDSQQNVIVIPQSSSHSPQHASTDNANLIEKPVWLYLVSIIHDRPICHERGKRGTNRSQIEKDRISIVIVHWMALYNASFGKAAASPYIARHYSCTTPGSAAMHPIPSPGLE